MCVAHLAGLVVIAIIGVFTSSDPSLDGAIVLLLLGGFLSLFLFLPALAITLILARPIYENVIPFVLVGPLLVGAFMVSVFGVRHGGGISIGVAFSSAVFFLLARQYNPAEGSREDEVFR